MTATTTTQVVAHRSSRRLAEKYIASFADTLGDTVRWDGSRNIPIHIEWTVVRSEQGGFDIVSTVTLRDPDGILTDPDTEWLEGSVTEMTETEYSGCRNTEHAHLGEHDRMEFCTPHIPS